jgi:hypothetical protein
MPYMSQYVPQMSQVLKDHIWTQLSLGHTMKQIYNKHKAISWAQVNARETMTWDDFIKQQDIAYLDWKHKIASSCLHKNPAISIQTWAFNHLEITFYFQDVGEINGFMSHSQLGFKLPCNCNLWSHVATMGQFQWMLHSVPTMWNFICYIVVDTPQELCALRWILNSLHHSFVYSNVLMCMIRI